MPWQYGRKLVQRDDSALTFELTLREDGVLRDVVQVTVPATGGLDGIKAALKRAALHRAQGILAERAGSEPEAGNLASGG